MGETVRKNDVTRRGRTVLPGAAQKNAKGRKQRPPAWLPKKRKDERKEGRGGT